LATIVPALPQDADSFSKTVSFQCTTAHGLGKKGKKVGIKLKIILAETAKHAVRVGDLEAIFDKVGKGLPLPWKVEAEVDE
jgi:retrograde regulation protein 2